MLIIFFKDGTCKGIRCNTFEILPDPNNLLYYQYWDDHTREEDYYKLSQIEKILCDNILIFEAER